jgi:hypothetical protein
LNHQSAVKHMFQVMHLYVEVVVYTTQTTGERSTGT